MHSLTFFSALFLSLSWFAHMFVLSVCVFFFCRLRRATTLLLSPSPHSADSEWFSHWFNLHARLHCFGLFGYTQRYADIHTQLFCLYYCLLVYKFITHKQTFFFFFRYFDLAKIWYYCHSIRFFFTFQQKLHSLIYICFRQQRRLTVCNANKTKRSHLIVAKKWIIF